MKYQFIFFAALLLMTMPSYAQQNPTPVFVTEVQKKPFVDEIEALGTLRANENVDLSSTVTERVKKISFESGQRVKEGDVLVEMDISEELALLNEEKSVVNEARRQVDRLKPLIERGATSQSTMDEAMLELQTAQARIAAIESQIDERRIIAPFDGKLGLRNISVGTMAQPGTLITTIDDDSIMKLDFSVPEVYLMSLQEGGKIIASAKAFPDETFEGTVQSIDSRVDPVTRAISIRALIDNADYKLRPGMLMRVTLQRNPRQALVVPEEALVPKGDKNYIFVVNGTESDTTVSLTEIEMGSRSKGEAEITSGLSEGDRIVTHGSLRIQDGASVKITATDEGDESLDDMLQKTSKSEG